MAVDARDAAAARARAAAGFATTRAYRAYVLALLVAVGVVGWVDRNVFAVLLQSMKIELGLSDTELGLLGGAAFGVFYATVGLPVASLADRCDRRALIALALGLWSVMTAACGLASGFSSLFLARIGVGIGEAGGSPPSQSLIADYFPPERRARALGVFYLYIPCGFVVGFLSGGWLDELVGWRLAFVVVGLPGVLLALIVRLTLREPPRGALERAAPQDERAPSLREALRHFVTDRALRLLPLAGAVHGVGAFAAALWLPAYFARTFGAGSATVGGWMAVAYGVGGTIGVLCGGRIADALVQRSRDVRWYAWLCAAAIAATLPFTLVTYSSTSAPLAVGALIASTLLSHAFLGPVAALVQSLAGVTRRATAAAFYLFLVNLVSMSVGPAAAGLASDYFEARLGAGSLGYALLSIVAGTTVLASLQFVLAARALPRPGPERPQAAGAEVEADAPG